MSGSHYVVRGAMINCSFGSHFRKLDMPVCHGSYIREKPMMHEMDCMLGVNVMPFGACTSPAMQGPLIMISDPDGIMPVPDDNGVLVMPQMPAVGRLCAPALIGKWMDAYDETLVDGTPALRINCTLSCVFGGIIGFINSGQDV